jgi:hypothetical protein
MDAGEPRWFGVRSIYLFGKKKDGTNVYEERVVVFSAQDFAEAHRKAEAESEEYAKFNKLISHADQMAYEQDGDRLVDGYEVWSELFESADDLETFYQKRYGQYAYHPDP